MSSGGVNYRLAKVFIKHHISLSVIEDEDLKGIFKDLAPQIKLTTRDRLLNHYIYRLSRKTDTKFFQQLSEVPDYSLSIEFDHWSDGLRRSLLGVVGTFSDGTKHLIELLDTSLEGHSSDAIVSSLEKALSRVPPLKVNSIISDAAAACCSARQKFVDPNRGFVHAISHRCMAHMLNLMGGYICERDFTKLIVTFANHLVNRLSNDVSILARLSAAGVRRCQRSVPTRWYSTVVMLESLLEVKPHATKIYRELDRTDHPEYLLLVDDQHFWPDLKKLLAVLKPIADCIATSESASGSVSDTMRNFMQMARHISEYDPSDKFYQAAREAFFTYFDKKKLKDEYELLLTAHLIDRRNNCDFLTDHAKERIFLTIARIAKKMGFKGCHAKKSLSDDFRFFVDQRGSFSAPADENVSPED